MTVYVLLGCVDYEGDEVIDVFRYWATAKAAAGRKTRVKLKFSTVPDWADVWVSQDNLGRSFDSFRIEKRALL